MKSLSSTKKRIPNHKRTTTKTKIEDDFFKNYAGSGKPYSKVWRKYCYFDECCALFKDKSAPQLKSIAVLGAATGEICEGFNKHFGVNVHGCEINSWAHSQIPKSHKRRIRHQDMRPYIKSVRSNGRIFDLVFTNSLIYLPEHQVLPFLKSLSKCSRFVHSKSSTTGSKCPDPWRRTLKPYKWWVEQFAKAGFVMVPGKNRHRTYLWASLALKSS